MKKLILPLILLASVAFPQSSTNLTLDTLKLKKAIKFPDGTYQSTAPDGSISLSGIRDTLNRLDSVSLQATETAESLATAVEAVADSGAGNTTRLDAISLRTVLEEGATGVGYPVNDSLMFSNAIKIAMATNSTLLIPAGRTYYLPNGVGDIPSGLRMRAEGSEEAILTQLTIAGTLAEDDTVNDLGSGIFTGVTTIPLVSSTGFTVGDTIVVTNGTVFEWNVVTSVTTGQIGVKYGVSNDYANGSIVQIIHPKHDIVFEGITVTDLTVSAAWRIDLDKMKFNRGGLTIENSRDIKVTGSLFDSSRATISSSNYLSFIENRFNLLDSGITLSTPTNNSIFTNNLAYGGGTTSPIAISGINGVGNVVSNNSDRSTGVDSLWVYKKAVFAGNGTPALDYVATSTGTNGEWTWQAAGSGSMSVVELKDSLDGEYAKLAGGNTLTETQNIVDSLSVGLSTDAAGGSLVGAKRDFTVYGKSTFQNNLFISPLAQIRSAKADGYSLDYFGAFSIDTSQRYTSPSVSVNYLKFSYGGFLNAKQGFQFNVGRTRNASSLYVHDAYSDNDTIPSWLDTTPHSLFMVERTGPSSYDTPDNLGAALLSMDTKASSAVQPAGAYAVWGNLNFGFADTGQYTPANGHGVLATANNYTSGKAPNIFGLEAYSERGSATRAGGIHIINPSTTSQARDTSYGLLVDDQETGVYKTADIGLRDRGRIEWTGGKYIQNGEIGGGWDLTGTTNLDSLHTSLGATFNGNVGIGITSPVSLLNIKNTDGAKVGFILEDASGIGYPEMFRLQAGDGSDPAFRFMRSGSSAGDFRIMIRGGASPSANFLAIHSYDKTDAQLIIHSNGNVGIAKTTPTRMFDVTGDVVATDTVQGASVVATGLSSASAFKSAVISASLTDGTPTDAEIDTATGFASAAAAGAGYERWVKDADGTSLMYRVVSDGTSWWIYSGTVAP